jgi:hypothetical protein
VVHGVEHAADQGHFEFPGQVQVPAQVVRSHTSRAQLQRHARARCGPVQPIHLAGVEGLDLRVVANLKQLDVEGGGLLDQIK